MQLSDIINEERIQVVRNSGDVPDKPAALSALARMLAPALAAPEAEVLELLREREALQSTGIGEGVAIPHGALDRAEHQAAALLLFPQGIDFDAIDGHPVQIVFGVVGPKRATGEHLRTLARISRLLRDEATRRLLSNADSAKTAFGLIAAHDAK